jgi:uncharacterized protein
MAFIDRKELLAHLQDQFEIEWQGCHGVAHWTRVRANGLMLASETGANVTVVELFALFHDSRRVKDQVDEGHGSRGAVLASELKGRYFEATDSEMDLLKYACDFHSDGLLTGDATVLTCWDADRLDLGRVGITPERRYLCTDAAKRDENFDKAIARALTWRERWRGGPGGSTSR